MSDEILSNPALTSSFRPARSLNGTWRFRMDPRNEGKKKKWFHPGLPFKDTIKVPGCWQAQGFGNEPDRMLKHQYRGTGWYKKRFHVPSGWRGKLIRLVCGGIFPAADVWVNENYIGYTKSSRSEMAWEIGKHVYCGKTNVVTIAVSRPELGLDGLFGYDELTGYWAGLWRGVKIEATEKAHVRDLFCLPDLDRKGVELTVELSRDARGAHPDCVIQIVAPGEKKAGVTRRFPPSSRRPHEIKTFIRLKDVRSWSPETPHLYRVILTLKRADRILDEVEIRFGMRKIEVKGDRILLNGKPVFLRGFCDDMHFPETLCPPADVASHRRRITAAKEYGFNYAKSCCEAFPPEFLRAADELGLLVTQEMPFGLRAHRLLRQNPPKNLKDLYRKELDNIVRQSRNHPSVINYAMTSELYINQQSKSSFSFFNQKLPKRARRLHPGALVTDITLGPGSSLKTKFGRRVTDICEVYINATGRDAYRAWPIERCERPIILHEYAWWSSYPNPELEAKYERLPVKPYWITEAKAAARKKGLLHLIPTFVKNSETLQAICRKEGLEFARKSPLVSGYVLWALPDTAWAVEGLLDDFYAPKNVSAREFRKVNDEVVLLLDDDYRCTFWAGDYIKPDILLSNFSSRSVAGTIRWRLRDGEKVLLRNKAALKKRIAPGRVEVALPLSVRLPELQRPKKLILEVEYADSKGRTITTNSWPFWVFPRTFYDDFRKEIACICGGLEDAVNTYGYPFVQYTKTVDRRSLVVTDELGDEILRYLSSGGSVLLLQKLAKPVFPQERTQFSDLFRTVPWNAGTSGNSGTVIGRHPALGDFPHDGYCDFQFFELISGTCPFDMEALGRPEPQPVIRSIGNYRTAKRKSYMFEVKVGKGKMLVTSLRIAETYNENHPATKYLLDQLIRYVLSARFKPFTSMNLKRIKESAGRAKKTADVFPRGLNPEA